MNDEALIWPAPLARIMRRLHDHDDRIVPAAAGYVWESDETPVRPVLVRQLIREGFINVPLAPMTLPLGERDPAGRLPVWGALTYRRLHPDHQEGADPMKREREPEPKAEPAPVPDGDASAAAESAGSADPFDDLSKIRLGQDFGAELGVRRLLTRVPVRKPDRQEWVRVRPGAEWRLEISALEFREDRDWYLVMPDVRVVLLSDVTAVRLHVAINRQGDVFFWPIKISSDGRRNPWLDTAMDAVAEAEKHWIRVVPGRGSYDLYTASSPELAEPDWPPDSLSDLLRLAFKSRIVDRVDHPIVQRLAGAI